jgi:hypothetical protein
MTDHYVSLHKNIFLPEEDQASQALCAKHLQEPTPQSWSDIYVKNPKLKPESYQQYKYHQCLYGEFRKKWEALQPRLECREGDVNIWTAPSGQKMPDHGMLIHDPHSHQVLFEIYG